MKKEHDIVAVPRGLYPNDTASESKVLMTWKEYGKCLCKNVADVLRFAQTQFELSAIKGESPGFTSLPVASSTNCHRRQEQSAGVYLDGVYI